MAKKTKVSETTENQTSETKNTEQTPSPVAGTVSRVKGIKNSLLRDLPIGTKVKIGGTIRGLTDKEGNYGSFTQFKGDFGLIDHNGVIYRSNTLYLPSIAADMLKNDFLAVAEKALGNASIEFGFYLLKVENAKSNTGYEWRVETLKPVAVESDRVLALLA